jgi:hypothetical protein
MIRFISIIIRKAPVLCVMSLLVVGCAKKASHDHTAAPADAGATGDELAMLEQQLREREGQLEAVGVTTTARFEKKAAAHQTGDAAGVEATAPTTSPSPAAPNEVPSKPDAGGDRCTQVCEITTAICALEDQICGLLPRHPGEARYQAACDRSSADCQLATEACHACTGN